MNKLNLIDKVNLMTKDNFDKEKLKSWIMCLEGTSTGRVNPTVYKKGDVFMHPVFKHPYVLLEKKGAYWVCGLFTTEATCKEIIEPCNSRFFATSYFTRVLFTVEEPVGNFCNPFENQKQITSVYKQLKAMFV